MRVAFVGGAGEMGRTAVRVAASFDEIDEIVVLDRDGGAARDLVDSLGPTVTHVETDILTGDVADALRGCDAVLNTLGPFTTFGTVVLEAALTAGCAYVDINDDWEPTLTALELDERARRAGVTAVIGMGASPGVSNVLAAELVTQLDETHELLTGWSLAGTKSESGDASPTAAMHHFLHQCSGTIRALEDSTVVDVPPVQRILVPLPGGEPLEAWTVGHPEAATLPLTVPDLKRCFNVMTGPAWYFELVRATVARLEAGDIDTAQAAEALHAPRRPAGAPRAMPAPDLWAWAKGVRDGRPSIVMAQMSRSAPGGMSAATAIPAVMVLRMILTGMITEPGVHTPEQVVPFARLVDSLDPWYSRPSAGGDLVTITSSDGDQS